MIKKSAFLMLIAAIVLPAAAAMQQQTVRIGFFQFDGYHMEDWQGDKSGYGYEYLQHLALYTGWTYEYAGYDKNWSDMLQMLDDGEIDLVTSARKTPERLEKFDFSDEPIGISATIMTVKSGNREYLSGDYDNWSGIRVGMLRDNSRNLSFDAFAAEKGFSYEKIYFDDFDTMIRELKNGGGIDAIVSSNLRAIRDEWIYETFDPFPFYAIVKKGNRQLLDQVNLAIRQINTFHSSLQSELRRKYYSSATGTELPLSAEERDFIKDANQNGLVFKALLNPDRAPLSSFKNGVPQGIVNDMAAEIIARTGLNIQIVQTAGRREYLEALMRPDITIQLDAWHNYSDAEKRHFRLTDPYLTATISRLRLKNASGIPEAVAAVRDSDLIRHLKNNVITPDRKIHYYDSIEDAVDAVLKGREDELYIYTRSAEAVIYNDDTGLLASDLISGYSTDYSVAIRDSAPPLLGSIINKAVNSLDQADLSRILQRHSSYPTREFTWSGFFRAHPIAASLVPAAVLLALIFFLIAFIVNRRRSYRQAEVVSKLPLRYMVVNASGEVLQSSRNDKTAGHPLAIGNIGELKDLSPGLVLEKVREAIARNTSSAEYEIGDRKRSAAVTKLPFELFRQEAAIWVSQDTTELQNTRAYAQANAERFRLTLTSIADGVIATDENERITMANQSAAAMIGMPENEIIGRELAEVFRIVSYLDDSPVKSPVRQALATGLPVAPANHTDLLAHDGRRYHIADTAAPIRDSAGKIVGVVLVFRDVTREYEQRDRLAERNMLLETASAIADMTHFIYTGKAMDFAVMPDERYWPRQAGRPVSPHEWIHPADRKAFIREWVKLRRRHTTVMNHKYRAGRPGESVRYFEIQAGRAMIGEGGGDEYIGSIREITRQKRQELKHQEMQQRQIALLAAAHQERAMILNNINIPICLYDVEGRLLHVNTATCAVTGKSEAELMADPFREMVIFDFGARQQESLLKLVINTGKSVFRELRIGERDYIVHADPVTDDAGKLVNVVESAVDVTEIEEAKRQQEAALKAAQAAELAKSYFLATMSHEIRTPLNAVIGFSELLRSGDVSAEEQRDYLEAISCSGNALLTLINDVLDLSKIDAGQLKIVPVATEIPELLAEIRSIFLHKASEKKLKFNIEAEPEMPVLMVDAIRLRQVLLNLAGNAIKFTNDGEVSIKAMFRAQSARVGKLVIEVSDTGIGISDAFRKNLFQPFTQQDMVSGNRKYGGTGLGLTISRRLAENMGGELNLKSSGETGSVFELRLNAVGFSTAATAGAESSAAPGVMRPTAPGAEEAAVLLVDDVPGNLKVLAAIIRKLGLHPVSADSGSLALAILEEQKIKYILTDMWMPEMNGAELARKIRKLYPDTLITVITADVEIGNNFPLEDFNAVMVKPVTIPKLRDLLELLRQNPDPGKMFYSEIGRQ